MRKGVWSRELRLLNRDVDLYRRLHLSRLFELFQEASIAHTQALGMGREKTLDRGLLWVVTRQQALIRRMPEYDEQLRLLTWPGETMHLFFPRQYRLETPEGKTLVRGSALWMLVDRETRRFVFPENHGIVIPGLCTDEDLPLPPAPAALPTEEERSFTVPYSYVDMNGHMNNTRYFDLAEDCLGAAAGGRELIEAAVEYKNEARLGEELSLRWGREKERYYLTGTGNRPVFNLSLTYRA